MIDELHEVGLGFARICMRGFSWRVSFVDLEQPLASLKFQLD
ncbi:hypothetical protein LF1_33560 [Rubripirellula obstinata]|uniref:Uncharacterized protein n=1 Tax=Rubripirellula obstinata TaxID=406547 RepID=A0A5B1CNG8_9BACT|nr:hypothetical protein LF1_33560 [Rubripirellula obstinata]